MKKAGLEKIFIGVLSISMMTNTMGFLQPVKSLDFTNNLNVREVNEDTVVFNQEYAKLGEPLTVTSNLSGEISYKWVVGDKVVSNAVSYTPTVNDLEKFISVEISNGSKTLSTKTYFSRLPVVYINTENGADVTSKDYYINGEMKIQGNEQYNLETTKLYDGKIEIKGRGNSTWGLPKKPYKIKLDSKTNLFSMGKNKHWVLLANYYDSSNLRNTLSYDLSGALDMPQTETVHTGVVLNGKYVGMYQFCEQIRVDEKRVDVLNWDDEAKDLSKIVATKEGLDAGDLEEYLAENLGWTTSGKFNYQGKTYLISNYDYTIPSINGGYLLELDSNYDEVSKFKTNNNQPLMFKAPEFAASNQDMMNYVQNYIQSYEDAVMSKDYHSMYEGNKVHYSELFDMDSLIDYWLVTELFFNEDGMKKSTYMYKDVDDKFHMGPIWDMDWSSGASQSAAIPTNQWQTLYFPAYGNPNEPQLKQWYRYLIKDPYFVSCVKQRYEQVRNNQIADMMSSIEDYRVYLKEAGVANSSIWYGNTNTGENEINKLKSWLTNRLAFMDEQFSSLSKLYASLGVEVSDEQLILTDHNGIVLPSKDDYNGVSNARNLIKIEMNITDQNTKKVALYSNGELIDEASVAGGKVVFEYTLPASGNYVLQAYKLDQNNNIIGNKSISANLLVEPSITMELESIEINSLPNKLSYYQGEKLNLEGLMVNAVFNTGNKVSLKPEEYTVSSLTNEPGMQTVTINYNGKTVSFEVEVKELVLESLVVKQLPHKVEYYVGEKLDLSGLVIEGTYNNGTKEEITDYTVSKLTNKVGKQTITVSYQGKEITFTVVVSEITTSTNKTALSIALDMAESVTQEQLDKVVPAVANEFKAALQNAQDVYGNTSASQEEVDNAFDRLAKVMQMLEFYKGDKIALQKMMDQIASLSASDYTDSTWKALQAVLPGVNEVLGNVNAMQGEVDEVYTELVKAFVNLRLKPNKDLLQDLINKANGLNRANYTAASLKLVDEEAAKANIVLNDSEATAEEVTNAVNGLTKAMAGLEVNPANPPVENTTNNPGNTVKPGDTTVNAIKTGDEIPAYGLVAGVALLISLIAAKKKKCS
ncbi:CotH kinase family protein [Thomasclavelia sp.]